jgi:hypothetical protein
MPPSIDPGFQAAYHEVAEAKAWGEGWAGDTHTFTVLSGQVAEVVVHCILSIGTNEKKKHRTKEVAD